MFEASRFRPHAVDDRAAAWSEPEAGHWSAFPSASLQVGGAAPTLTWCFLGGQPDSADLGVWNRCRDVPALGPQLTGNHRFADDLPGAVPLPRRQVPVEASCLRCGGGQSWGRSPWSEP